MWQRLDGNPISWQIEIILMNVRVVCRFYKYRLNSHIYGR